MFQVNTTNNKDYVRGVLIDPFNKVVRDVVIPRGLDAMYELLQCDLVDVVTCVIGDVWVDDEGLLKDREKQEFFYLRRFGVLAGRAVVFDANDEGETIDARVTAAEVQQNVLFMTREDVAQFNTQPSFRLVR